MFFIELSNPVPTELRCEEFVLRPITPGDAELDYAAVMETRKSLRLWEQSAWPEDDFTVEANRNDLVDLEQRHAAHRAFTYTVLDPDGAESLGCVYIFPTGATFLTKASVTPVGNDEWANVDAVVYFWVRLSRVATGMDERLLAVLRRWFTEEWKLERTVYVTKEEFRQQLALLGRTDLAVKFELIEPGKQGKYLAFG